MIVHRTRFVRIGELMFGELPSSDRVDLRQHLQRSTPLANATCTSFKTIHVDLARDEATLLSEVKKGTRYEVRRAETDGVVCHAESLANLEAFVDFYARFATSKRLAPPPRTQVDAYAQGGVLVLSRATDRAGETIVWHAHLVANGRARLWLSATAVRASDDGDKARAAAIGRANRLLHWRDMLRFREHGCTVYDLGGWDGDSVRPELRGISKFKEEFGGRVVEELNCVEAVTLRGRAYRAAELVMQRRHRPHAVARSPRDLLRCPDDAGILADMAGGLRCATCARVYPIEDGIVRFVTTLDDETKASEMQARDDGAESYDGRFTALRNAIEMPPSVAALDPQADDVVVELGCGSGRMTLAYVDRVASVIGLDFSLASLRVLQRKLSPEQREKVILVQADISRPPIKSASATKIASFQVFEHLPSSELRIAAARAAGELLARRGRLVLSVYNWNWNKQRLAQKGIGDNTAKQGFHAGEHRVYYFNFEPHDLVALFEAARVEPIAVRGLDAQFPGIDLVGRFAVPINRVLERIPLGRRLGHLLLAAGVK